MTFNDICVGAVIAIYDSEDEAYRLVKILFIKNQGAWIIMNKDLNVDLNTAINLSSSVTIFTSIEALLTWGNNPESRVLRTEEVSKYEVSTCDHQLYPDEFLVKVNPVQVS